ncbi:4-nitrophenyl phosphatase [Alkalihalobacillus xiaoxiensis]|uniref:4-nitrophenyl phosphatase n=1 Tax=Shouchella xiaoxiensis TaxID=766895 RepID=A0ABS2SS05_9BACI|nr:TIGR01457 family HAD-type hydrolase [Shouchella xiaoxiensis]MBM7838289.1 4-nitrophenyl phosphatase [Shouchella xiaoxiensis]
MKAYKSYLFDLDGTIYHGNKAISSAIQFLNQLELKNIPYGFVTNNSTQTPDQVAKKLTNLGVKVEARQVVTSSIATAAYVRKHYRDVSVFVIGEVGLQEAFSQYRQDSIRPNLVVVGLDRKITHDKMSVAARCIVNGATFIATNPDRMITQENGLVCGNGAIAQAIAYAANTEPVVIGKPSAEILHTAVNQLGFNALETVFVGDNYETDILAGIRAKMDTIHVQTGVTVSCQSFDEQPTYSIPSLINWSLL